MKEPKPAWMPCNREPADISAIQALERGDANPDQQKRALAWIINELGMTYQPTHFPDERNTTFANGRRYVGLILVECLKINVSKLVRSEQ